MTNPDTPSDGQAPIDPKEQMRAALEAKKAAHHKNADGPDPKNNADGGHTAGKAGARREFRRKSGG